MSNAILVRKGDKIQVIIDGHQYTYTARDTQEKVIVLNEKRRRHREKKGYYSETRIDIVYWPGLSELTTREKVENWFNDRNDKDYDEHTMKVVIHPTSKIDKKTMYPIWECIIQTIGYKQYQESY